MSHLQYIPGDPRLVDQLVYELKSKGIFDQFRKDCIADVDTRPAYQNLRQRVETSVSTFLSRQCWKPDLNKNQLREKLRKHILDGNYLEQGVERIVDQVVNPKVASVFIPQVEDLVYNYLGITRKKSAPVAETSNGKLLENDLLPTDLEAVSPDSVKSHDDKNEEMDVDSNVEEMKMEVDNKEIVKDETDTEKVKADPQDSQLSGLSDLTSNDSNSLDKIHIPLPSEEIKPENIPAPENSPPKAEKLKVELEKIQLPQEPNPSTDIPLPDGIPKLEKESYFKTELNSEDDDSSSDSSLRRNMSPLTPIRNFNNENSCDAQQAFENNSEDNKNENNETLEPSTFRFTIEAKETENNSDAVNAEKKETETLAYQFDNQMNMNTFNTPLYDESSSSNHLRIDYESDVNSKMNTENKVPEPDHNSEDSRKDKKPEEKKSSHKSSHHRDPHRHSSSRDRRSDSKQSSSKDTKSEKKSSKDDHKSSKDDHKSSSKSSSHKDKSSDRSDKKDGRDSSKHRSSSSHKSSSSHRDSKSHRSSSTSHKHSSSSKHSDEKKSSSSTNKDRSDKSSEKYSKEKSSKDSKSSSSHRSDKDRKSSSSSKRKSEDKDKERQKKDKKEADDHYSASGRGNPTRRSTDRDSNDGNSSSSKGSHNQPSLKSSESKKDSKGSTSKSDNTSTSGDSPAPSDKDSSANEMGRKIKGVLQVKPIVRIENHLETPISSPPRLPFVPDVTLKKPKFAANMQEAKKLMKMRKFLDEEQKRMNQEAALLLEFQANVRPSLSQVYSSIPGPELEFACGASSSRDNMIIGDSQAHSDPASPENIESISDILSAAEQVDNKLENSVLGKQKLAIEISETIEAGGELEDEADGNPHAATVEIENIIGSDISGTCEMEVDIKDDKKVQVIDSGPNVIVENIEILPEIEKKELIFHNDTNNEQKIQIPESMQKDNDETVNPNHMEPENDGIEETLRLMEDDDKHTEYFQVTIITEELSETEDDIKEPVETVQMEEEICSGKTKLNYFAENEKYSAELERDTFSRFYKSFTEKVNTNKMYLINCDTYEENILKEVSQNFGNFEFVNYYKNGHFKLKSPVNVVKNVNLDSEITLPTNINGDREKSPKLLFSPVKSECSFELSSDYDAKLEEMVSKTSRKEIMEIILGGIVDDSTSDASEMPTIDYCTESNIESDTENSLKRKYCEVGSSLNNNRQVLTPNKIRKLSGSDQISSTTEESEVTSNNNVVSNPVRSKYLGRAKRVGLSRPKRSNLSNSPSSDKSVENYAENVQTSQPNGKLKGPRKVQRYDTSDLYKPKLHYLSRRNNIS